jgi:hypothetical protein
VPWTPGKRILYISLISNLPQRRAELLCEEKMAKDSSSQEITVFTSSCLTTGKRCKLFHELKSTAKYSTK